MISSKVDGSIWPWNRTQTGITTPDESGPESDGNEVEHS